MNALAERSDFLLLFRNTQLEKRLSHGEMKLAMGQLNDWLSRWSERGQMNAGQPLGDEGRVLSRAHGKTIADGPYAESKEAVGGYVIVQAADFEEAMKIAEEWPLLDFGATVEVRPVRTQCAGMEQAGMKLVELGAGVA